MNNSGLVKEILDLLAKNKSGMSLSRLSRELRLSPEEKILLRKSVKTLENQGLILKLRKKYFIRPQSNITHGRFVSSPRGFGFVIPEGEYLEDIFVSAQSDGGAYHGDLVEVQYKEKGKKGKPHGRIIKILRKGKQSLLGLCRVQSGQVFFLAFAAASPQEVPIDCAGHPVPKSGDVVRVHRDTLVMEEVLGSLDDQGVDTKVILERYNLEDVFSQEALEEAKKIPNALNSQQKRGRVDHSDWQTITIDGENAKDFDDAVSIKFLSNRHYLLGVHIADVAEYVRPETALDRDAKNRGTSVYFPDLTLPMLPEKLSNGICSLRPREEKLTLSVIMEIDNGGRVLNVDIHPSWIRTVERMTYNSVLKIIEVDDVERKKFSPLVQDLFHMRDLSQILREKRSNEGGLDFDLTEPELVYEQGSLQSVKPVEANQAHHIIEEFMVLANEAVAQFLSSQSVPLIYRVHPKPLPKDLDGLRKLLLHFNIKLPISKRIGSKDLQSVLEKVKGKPEEKFITIRVLRSLRLAVYSDENYGHYGLAKEKYTHFTSPIRRYPDLIVHRVLKHILERSKMERNELAAIARHCSERERAADEAERDLIEWRIYRFLKKKLGDEFEGIIIDFTKAGLIVELDDYFVDGLIPYSDLGGDYFYKKTDSVLLGRKTGKAFSLGSRIRVILVSVDPILRRMNLMISL
ncbi:MAG: ribonuclease R [Candidatus Aminicenantes bacterium]|nr:MAG: ribonuclease R [Candidatus Aminicenantes bacterium]